MKTLDGREYKLAINGTILPATYNDNGLDDKTVFQYFEFVGFTTYRTLINIMETMVRTLPLYVQAFKEYIQKKEM